MKMLCQLQRKAGIGWVLNRHPQLHCCLLSKKRQKLKAELHQISEVMLDDEE